MEPKSLFDALPWTPIKTRAKYRNPVHGKFKAHYDHQPGVRFMDEQGKRHIVPDKRNRHAAQRDTRISDAFGKNG